MRFETTPDGYSYIRYDPKKVNPASLAPPPPDPETLPRPSKEIGKNTAPLTLTRRKAAKDRQGCDHEFRKAGPAKPEFGIERVRARCAKCKKEKIMAATDVPPTIKRKTGPKPKQ